MVTITQTVVGRYGVTGVTDAQLHKRPQTWSRQSCEPDLASGGQRATVLSSASQRRHAIHLLEEQFGRDIGVAPSFWAWP